MGVHVNYLAVLLAAISSMIIGWVWYARPVLGNAWIRLAKLDEKAMKAQAAKCLTIAFVLSLVMAFAIANLGYIWQQFFHGSFFTNCLHASFFAWAGIAFTRTVTHDAFEQRPWRLTAMNVANMFVTMMVMGAIIGLLKP